MGHKVRIAALILAANFFGGTLIYAAYHQFYMRGLEAEAKLMMSYAHTLERVYKLENRHFVYWDEFYGSPQGGVDRCAQPEGAAEIGFMIPGCHREGAAFPRYAYRILKNPLGERYRIEAISGSDSKGRSVVCFQPEEHELWQSSQNLEFTQVVSCW